VNVSILVLSDLVALAIVKAIPGWAGAVLIASVVGLLVAMRLKASFASFVLATMTAVMLSEFAIPLRYGREALRGAPTHFALLLAAAIGVLLGALLFRRSSEPVEPGNDVLKVSATASEMAR
jgi:hypothetical protein